MKIIFGFNDIRPDGMGTEAMNLMRSIKRQGIQVQPLHAWNKIDIPGYIEEFNPIFVADQHEEPRLEDIIADMVQTVNADKDCMFFSHFGSPNWACIVPYLRKDIRVIVSVHSITPSALKIALAYRKRTAAFITISYGVRTKLLKKLSKTEQNKVHLITNAIDTSLYLPHHISTSEKSVKIIFFGRIEDVTKGCDKIPQIAKILKDKGLQFTWDFYGYFHWGYEPRFYQQIKDTNVSDVIHYKGCAHPEEIPEILSHYDIMVMPSNHEGFGLALVEAMAAGLSCVASLIPDVTDMIMESGKEGFLIARNNISGFADAIIKLATNKSLRNSFGNAAIKKVKDNFSLEKQGQQYAELFQLLAATQTYEIIESETPLEQFTIPSTVKSHILARLLPISVKRLLKKFI